MLTDIDWATHYVVLREHYECDAEGCDECHNGATIGVVPKTTQLDDNDRAGLIGFIFSSIALDRSLRVMGEWRCDRAITRGGVAIRTWRNALADPKMQANVDAYLAAQREGTA